MINLTDNLFLKSEFTLLIIFIISFTVVFIAILRYRDNKEQRDHEKKMQESKNDWGIEESKEILKLIKDIYN